MKNEQARPGKRPLRSLSAEEKMSAIQRVHDGESKASVARDIGVPESTLRGWCKSEHKIRGMARNSSTPESEAHSPASSSGANASGSNMSPNGDRHSNEDDVPASKKQKLEHAAASAGLSAIEANSDSNDARTDSKVSAVDYMNLLNNITMQKDSAASSMLLQQLGGLFNNGGSAAANILAARNLASLQQGTNPLHTVGLVENGLQYARNIPTTSNGLGSTNSYSTSNSSSNNHRRHTISGPQTEPGPSPRSSNSRRSHHAVSNSDLSPSTSVSSSRRSGQSAIDNGNAIQFLQRQYLQHQQQQLQQQTQQYHRQMMNNIGGSSGGNSSRSKRNSSSSANNGYTSGNNNSPASVVSSGSSASTTTAACANQVTESQEIMMQWIAQYGQYIQQQASAAALNARNLPQNNLFWNWCKVYCANNNITEEEPVQTTDKKSPERVKANLDRLLSNNNSSNERNFNTENGNERSSFVDEQLQQQQQQQQQQEYPETEDEAMQRKFREREEARRAIEHGEHFVGWLAGCSDPNVSLYMVRQLRQLLSQLRNTRLAQQVWLKSEKELEPEQGEDLSSSKDNGSRD